MKKSILCAVMMLQLSVAHAETQAEQAFNQIFANQKMLHAFKQHQRYDLICTDLIEPGENRPARFNYDAAKKTLSFIFMERNTYEVTSIERDRHNFIVRLDDGSLVFTVSRVNSDIYRWHAAGHDTDEDFYSLFYQNDWQELRHYKVDNACKQTS